MVHDFPDEAKFLSDDDRKRVIRRLKLDGQASANHEKFQMTYFWQSVKDWKTWAFAVIYMGNDGPLYAFSLFIPTIIKTGYPQYSSTVANLLSVPPYAAAAILTVALGFIADRTRARGWCNIITSLLAIAGFAMLLGSQDPNVKYAGTFLGALGICEWNALTFIDGFTLTLEARPDHREYHHLVLQQHRRRLQTRRHPRVRNRMGKPQRRGLEQRLPNLGLTRVHVRPRRDLGLPDRFLVRREPLHAFHAAMGEQAEESWKEGLSRGGQERGGDLYLGR